MIYFKSVLIGLGAVLLGCVLTPIAMTMWISWKSGVDTVSFSPMGLENHLAHSRASGFSSLRSSLQASWHPCTS